MENNNIKRTFYRFLNEGKAESFRDAYYPEIDDYILNKIIEIDPESNGDDVSEWGKLLMKLNPTQSDIEQAGEDISIIAKAAELGKDIPSLNDIETMEDLHYLAVDIANENGHMSDDEINSQEESLNCPIAFDDGGFRVIEINSPEAAEHYGKGTMWPWAAQGTNGGMFEELSQRGTIYVVKNETDGTIYSLVKLGNRMRITDENDEPVNKNMFPQELISTVMNVNESVTKFIKEKNHRNINENIVKNIISALNENYSKKHIKGSNLKNAMNAVCECVTKKSDINTVVKGKLKTVVESYNKMGKKITTEDYTKVLNLVKESFTKKRNSTVLKENELHNLLIEAVRKNVQRITEEFDEEYGEDPAWWEYGYEPGREGEMEHDFAERDNFDRMRTNKQHREMDALANQRRNNQYFPEEENDDVRRWINGEDIFESAPIGGYAEYEGEDINYESVYEQAIDAIIRHQKDCKPLQSAREIIDALGFREDSFNEEDWETVYSACEDALSEEYANGYVVIDGTGAVRGQFERGDYESAIEYANELAIESGLKASFDVYGVERDGYSIDDYDSTKIYSTYDNENELRNMMFNK